MSTYETGSDVRSRIEAFIRTNYLYMQPDLVLQPGDQLLGLGLIDSLAFVELVEHVQSEYGVEVRDQEITENNFGSVEAIASFIEQKRA